jgi:hypothetical protein
MDGQPRPRALDALARLHDHQERIQSVDDPWQCESIDGGFGAVEILCLVWIGLFLICSATVRGGARTWTTCLHVVDLMLAGAPHSVQQVIVGTDDAHAFIGVVAMRR